MTVSEPKEIYKQLTNSEFARANTSGMLTNANVKSYIDEQLPKYTAGKQHIYVTRQCLNIGLKTGGQNETV